MMPSDASLRLNVVATETLIEDGVDRDARRASSAPRAECRADLNVRLISGSTSSRLFSAGFRFGAE